MNFRPESYFKFDDWIAEVLTSVKGELRRRELARRIEESGVETYEEFVNAIIEDEIDPALVREQTPDEKMALGRIRPELIGGEFLPDFDPMETEIARASLRSVLGDIISVRAKLESGLIHYYIVDEYDTQFDYKPKTSREPLTMSELTSLIDSVDHVDKGGWDWCEPGLNRMYRDANAHRKGYNEDGSPPESLVDFTTITSEFYPELYEYYVEDTKAWLKSTEEWDWENLSNHPEKRADLSEAVLAIYDYDPNWKPAVIWRKRNLGRLFDFFTDVVAHCDAFRLDDWHFARKLEKDECMMQTKGEEILSKQIADNLAALIWRNRKAIRRLARVASIEQSEKVVE